MRIFIAIVVILALVLLVAGLRHNSGGSSNASKSDLAPDFTLTDLTGAPATLSAFRGKVVLLDFWATWCPPCQASLPHTQATSVSAAAKAGDLVVLAINDKEPKGTVASFLKANHYTFRVLLDPTAGVFGKYGVDGIPYFVVVNRDGTIAWQNTGFDKTTMDAEIAKALAKK